MDEDWSAQPTLKGELSAATALLDLAERLERGGNPTAALASYRWALALAPAESDLAQRIAALLASR